MHRLRQFKCVLLLIAAAGSGGAGATGEGADAAFGLDTLVRAAKADAARRSGLAGELRVLSAEAVTWPSGALGCPDPNVRYTLALVPGYRIRLQALDQMFDYHANQSGRLLLCPKERSVEPVPAAQR
jgi:hypothetical protein